MAVIASRCPWINVVLFDDDNESIAAWSAGIAPFFEPGGVTSAHKTTGGNSSRPETHFLIVGLTERVSQVIGKNLFFTSDLEKAVQDSEVSRENVSTTIVLLRCLFLAAGMLFRNLHRTCRVSFPFFACSWRTFPSHNDFPQIIFVSVNAPLKKFGAGAGKAADLSSWEHAARRIARFATSDKVGGAALFAMLPRLFFR